MTCIVGLLDHESGRVYLGADSAATNDSGQRTIRADAKLFRLGDFLFGCTSSYRMIQLLRYHLTLPNLPEDLLESCTHEGEEDDSLFRYMATTFIDAIRTCLKDGGYAQRKDEREKGGFFLVGVAGRLFGVASDYQVEEAAIGYHAVGCGDDLALGALHATRQLTLPPEQRIRLALEAAEYHQANVAGPFVIKHLAPPQVRAMVRAS